MLIKIWMFLQFWARASEQIDQYYNVYDMGFNIKKFASLRKHVDLLDIKYISLSSKMSVRNIITSINVPRVTLEKSAETRVGLLVKFPLLLPSFNENWNESINISKKPKIKLQENSFTGFRDKCWQTSMMKLQLFAAKVLKTEFYYRSSCKGIHLSDRNIKRRIRVVC
jgi:hypothetical protein